jgi:hypothetical protein
VYFFALFRGERRLESESLTMKKNSEKENKKVVDKQLKA